MLLDLGVRGVQRKGTSLGLRLLMLWMLWKLWKKNGLILTLLMSHTADVTSVGTVRLIIVLELLRVDLIKPSKEAMLATEVDRFLFLWRLGILSNISSRNLQ